MDLIGDVPDELDPADLRALLPLAEAAAGVALDDGLPGRVEILLTRLGFVLSPVADAHLCCGSAGSYAVLQKELSERLLRNKVRNLEAGGPEQIVTANIGCLMHLQAATRLEVKHWIELLA